MTKMTFDRLATEIEETTVEQIAKEKVQQAWQAYEAKPEYKSFNKHDLIESMLTEVPEVSTDAEEKK